MANISSAFGEITFPAEFCKGRKALIEKSINAFNSESHGEYGISHLSDMREESDDESITLSFFGSGRWTFHSSIEALGLGKKEGEFEYNPSTRELREELAKTGTEVFIRFTDEEGGNMVLYVEEGKFSYKENGNSFDYIETNSEDYDYSERNLIHLNCYDGLDATKTGDREKLLAWLKESGYSSKKIKAFLDIILNNERFEGCITESEMDDPDYILEVWGEEEGS